MMNKPQTISEEERWLQEEKITQGVLNRRDPSKDAAAGMVPAQAKQVEPKKKHPGGRPKGSKTVKRKVIPQVESLNAIIAKAEEVEGRAVEDKVNDAWKDAMVALIDSFGVRSVPALLQIEPIANAFAEMYRKKITPKEE